jgi:hypothetical protein
LGYAVAESRGDRLKYCNRTTQCPNLFMCKVSQTYNEFSGEVIVVVLSYKSISSSPFVRRIPTYFPAPSRT